MISGQSRDVVFITPSIEPNLREESIGTLILAKKAIIEGFDVAIVRFWEADKTSYEKFLDTLCQKILSYNPKIVSFYCRGNEYHILIDLTKKVKAVIPQITTVFGGPQAELVAEETLNIYPSVDYICCGEGENTIVSLLNMILHNRENEKMVPGLVYRSTSGEIIRNQLPPMLDDNYIRPYQYYDIIPKEIISKSKSVTIDVGRGCPFSCTFCSTKTFWKQRYRLRDITNTVEEIEYIVSQYGNKLFSFSHDLFTVNKNRVSNFCDKISSLCYKIKWTCSARIDSVDEELIDKMAASGLVGIYYGIETGSEKMQSIIKKRLNIQRCYDIVKYSIDCGINVTASFIYGFPKENYGDLNKSLELIHKLMSLGADVQLHRLSFEKGSQLYDEYVGELICTNLYKHTEFGVAELANEIMKHPNVYSTFWDYNSDLRTQMEFLGTMHSIGREYPKTYIKLVAILIGKGHDYVETYKEMISTIQESLQKFEDNNVILSKSICFFLFEKMINRLGHNFSNPFITNNDTMCLLQILLAEKVYQEHQNNY